jgi:hypothetical protein
MLNNELKKMDGEQKRALAEKLLNEAQPAAAE